MAPGREAPPSILVARDLSQAIDEFRVSPVRRGRFCRRPTCRGWLHQCLGRQRPCKARVGHAGSKRAQEAGVGVTEPQLLSDSKVSWESWRRPGGLRRLVGHGVLCGGVAGACDERAAGPVLPCRVRPRVAGCATASVRVADVKHVVSTGNTIHWGAGWASRGQGEGLSEAWVSAVARGSLVWSCRRHGGGCELSERCFT